MKYPLVSIIVPIYNVEAYLKQCLDSILSQSYSNLEVILVNDGSTDQSQIIINEYLKKDSRCIGVMKENGGLSDSRNYGMQYVTGEYVLFVDSDDWLELSMVEVLIEASQKYQADIVQCGFYYAYPKYLLYDNRWYQEDDSPCLLNRDLAMKELVINEKIKNFAWGKLFKTTLVKDIPFKFGVLFEDVFWMHQIVHQLNKYVIVHYPLYYYRQRENSIVAQYRVKNLDIIKGQFERKDFLHNYYPHLVVQQDILLLQTILIHYKLLRKNKTQDPKEYCRKQLQNYVKNQSDYFLDICKNQGILYWQLRFFLLCPSWMDIPRIIDYLLRQVRVIQSPKDLKRIELGG